MIKKFTFKGVTFSTGKNADQVKIRIGDEIRYVSMAEIWGMAFEWSKSDETKDLLMPVQKTPIMKFKKVHTVQLKNDMKAGETLQFTCNIDVPTYVIEGMRDIISKEVPNAGKVLDDLLMTKLST